MSICRALPLVALLVALPYAAHAQFGGMPGLPGSQQGAPGGGFGGAPSAPPPACQELMSLQRDTQKQGQAIQKASERHASAVEACKLFRSFLSTETRMVKAFERNGPQCGVPAEVHQQLQKGHANALKIAKQVCDAAVNASRPVAPSLSDAFGTGPIMPEAGKKERGGAFDSLTGNVLAR